MKDLLLILSSLSRWRNLHGGGGAEFKTATDTRKTLDDIVTRSGRNTDVVLATIAATLFDPTVAVVAALLSALYVTGSYGKKPVHKMPATDYSRLRNIVYGAITNYTDRIRGELVGYGVPPDDVDRLMHDVVYKGYMDSLIATYA